MDSLRKLQGRPHKISKNGMPADSSHLRPLMKPRDRTLRHSRSLGAIPIHPMPLHFYGDSAHLFASPQSLRKKHKSKDDLFCATKPPPAYFKKLPPLPLDITKKNQIPIGFPGPAIYLPISLDEELQNLPQGDLFLRDKVPNSLSRANKSSDVDKSRNANGEERRRKPLQSSLSVNQVTKENYSGSSTDSYSSNHRRVQDGSHYNAKPTTQRFIGPYDLVPSSSSRSGTPRAPRNVPSPLNLTGSSKSTLQSSVGSSKPSKRSASTSDTTRGLPIFSSPLKSNASRVAPRFMASKAVSLPRSLKSGVKHLHALDNADLNMSSTATYQAPIPKYSKYSQPLPPYVSTPNHGTRTPAKILQKIQKLFGVVPPEEEEPERPKTVYMQHPSPPDTPLFPTIQLDLDADARLVEGPSRKKPVVRDYALPPVPDSQMRPRNESVVPVVWQSAPGPLEAQGRRIVSNQEYRQKATSPVPIGGSYRDNLRERMNRHGDRF